MSHHWDFIIFLILINILYFFSFDLWLLGLLHVEGGLTHLFGFFGSDDIEASLDGLDRLNRNWLLVKGFLWKYRAQAQQLTELFPMVKRNSAPLSITWLH